MSESKPFWLEQNSDSFIIAYALSLLTEATLDELQTYEVCEDCKTIIFNYKEALCPRCEEHLDFQPGHLMDRLKLKGDLDE